MGLRDNLWGWRRFNIKRGDLVLDVGSGAHPFVRADVLLDKFIVDDTERLGGIVVDRPFVCGDASALPFRDKTFDYLYSSNLVEHLLDPEKSFKEFSRVAKKGVLIVPNRRSESLFGWDYHTHLFWTEGEVLNFERKTDSNCGYFRDGYFHKAWLHDRNFKRFFLCNHADFELQYEWEGQILYRAVGKFTEPMNKRNEAVLSDRSHCIEVPQNLGVRSFVRMMVSRWVRLTNSPPTISIRDLLACPVCHVELIEESTSFWCAGCHRIYPSTSLNGIPLLLPEFSKQG